MIRRVAGTAFRSVVTGGSTIATMAARGLLRPGRPDRVARQLWTLHAWGYGIAAEVRSAAARDPDRPAVIDPAGTLTYGDLLDLATARAVSWRVRGIGPGTRLGLLRRNHREFLLDLVAAGLLGADVVLLNTGLAPTSLAEVARAQHLDALLRDPDLVCDAGVPDLDADPTDSGATHSDPARTGAAALAPPVREGRIIVLTSGTTGTPKGAVRPPAPGLSPLVSILSRIPIDAGDRILIAAPMFHTWGLAGLQIALATRATIVLRPRFDAADCLDTVVRERCDVLLAVPVMLARMLDEPVVPTGLRVVAVSGSALPAGLAPAFMDAYGEVLYNLYGSTEASWASIATPADLRRDPATAGRPPRGTTVRILDSSLRPATTGDIYVGNDMLFDGYTDAPERRRLDGLVPTGDVGHVEDGLLFVDGRADDMVVSGGENIHPAAVERILAEVAGVAEVAVTGVPDDEFGQRLAAWVVPRPGVTLDPDALRAAVRTRMAGFCVPRDVHVLTALPRNATGKIVTRELRPEPPATC